MLIFFGAIPTINGSNAREGEVAGYQLWKNWWALSSDQVFLPPVNNAGPLAKMNNSSSSQFHTIWLIN